MLQLSAGIVLVVTLLTPAEEAPEQMVCPFCVHLISSYCLSCDEVQTFLLLVPPTGDTDVLVSYQAW